MMDDEMLVTYDKDTVHITINRPARANALSVDLVEKLIEVVSKAADGDTRLVTFRGRGKNFCSGFDLTDFDTANESELESRLIRIEHLLQLINQAPMLTVAFAHGRVFGAGADVFCACDIRVAASDASFSFPGVQFGVVLGTRRLCQRIGADTAKQILLRCRKIESEEACSIGFATQHLEPGQWDRFVSDLEADTQPVSKTTMRMLLECLRQDMRDADMAALVESVSRPGLKQRIGEYRSRVRMKTQA